MNNPNADIILTIVDESFIHVAAAEDVFAEMREFFSFQAPNARFDKRVINKIWDGYIRLLNSRTQLIYYGLLPYIIEFAESRGYTLSYDDTRTIDYIDQKAFDTWVDSLNLHSADAETPENPKGLIKARTFQRFAVKTILELHRGTFVSATSSGKSLVAYLLCRALLETKKAKKILLVVPTIGLVNQMFADFADYSVHNGWNAKKMIHKIMQGTAKGDDSKQIYISTWQSIYSMDKSYFEQFDVVIGDEAHKWQAKCLRIIMEQAENAKYRMSMTGTLSGATVHKLILEGLFGKVYTHENTEEIKSIKELMIDKEVAKINLRCIILEYPSTDRAIVTKKRDYQAEVKFLAGHEGRNKFIKNLALSLPGITLVLCRLVGNHLEVLYKMAVAANKNPKRKIFLIHGDIDGDAREEIRRIVNTEEDALIFASEGTTAEGVNIPAVNNLIKASSTKSRIRNLQGIGRAMRNKGGQKLQATVYDIADDLSYNGTKNYTLEHFIERLQLYIENELDDNYQVHRVQIK